MVHQLLYSNRQKNYGVATYIVLHFADLAVELSFHIIFLFFQLEKETTYTQSKHYNLKHFM